MRFKTRTIAALMVITTICLALLGTTAFAKKEKVGTLEKGVFTDNRFGFTVAAPSEWRDGGLRDEYSQERITFIYKRVRVPARLREVPEEALRPTIMVFADSTTLPHAAIVDSLRNGITKDPFRDKILNKSVFFQRGAPNPPEVLRSIPTKVGGLDAVVYEVRREYAVQVPQQRGAPELVRDFRTGRVYLVPLTGAMIYIEMVCENQFQNELQPEFDAFINSFKFAGTASDSSAVTQGAAGE